MMRVRAKRKVERGAILPLAAMCAGVLVMLLASAVYLAAFSSLRTGVRSIAGLIGLAAMQGYAETECPKQGSCHEAKIDAALARAEQITQTNARYFDQLTLSLFSGADEASTGPTGDKGGNQESKGAGGVNVATVEAGSWYYQAPSENLGDPCTGNYPCFVAFPKSPADGQLANAIRVSGSTEPTIADKLLGAFGMGSTKSIQFEVIASQVPLRLVALIDLSSSSQEDNYLRPNGTMEEEGGGTVHAATPSTAPSDYGSPSPAPAGPAPSGMGFAGLALYSSVGPPEADPPADPPDGDFFAYQISQIDPNPEIVPDSVATVWDYVPDTRPGSGPYSASDHYKDDYSQVTSFGLSELERTKYANADYHPSMAEVLADSRGIWYPPKDDLEDYVKHYLVDTYRNDGVTPAYPGAQGPQPYRAFMEGLEEVVSTIQDRQVAGDMMSLVFFETNMYWKYVTDMTDDFNYIRSLINTQSIRDGDSSDFPDTAQPWLQLGLFPKAYEYTDIYSALVESKFQLSNVSVDGIPTINEIVLFGDGLSTCHGLGNSRACGNDFSTYKESLSEISDFVSSTLFSDGITLNVVQAGEQVGPHFLRMMLPPDGSDAKKGEAEGAEETECLTDDVARQLAIPMTRGTDYLGSTPPGSEFQNDFYGQQAWENRFETPFYKAAYDWYVNTVVSGGVYVPVRPVAVSCDDTLANDCSGLGYNPSTADREVNDPYCRSPGDQVKDGLADIIQRSIARSYAIVKSSGF